MYLTNSSQLILNQCLEASTLLLSIPDKKAGDIDEFVFNRVNIDAEPASSSKDKQVHVNVKRVIQETDHSTVYLGVLMGKLVVTKCCYNVRYSRDFHIEARVYKKRLEELQGRVVPVFFGYYLAVDDECGPYSLLLLEYCGRSLTTVFQDLEVEKRVKILNLLGEFHNEGRLHLTDFAERNVVVRNGEYRLIDFHDIEGHSCDWSEDMDWRVGEFFLTAQDSLPCSILGKLGDEFRIWNDYARPIVRIHGRIYRAQGLPPQNIIDRFIPYNFIGTPENWLWAQDYLRQIRKQMEEDPNFDINQQVPLVVKNLRFTSSWRHSKSKIPICRSSWTRHNLLSYF